MKPIFIDHQRMTSHQACQMLFGHKQRRSDVPVDKLIKILWDCLCWETQKGIFDSPRQRTQWNLRVLNYLLKPKNINKYVQTHRIQSIYGTFLYHPQMHIHNELKNRLSLLLNEVNWASSLSKYILCILAPPSL